MLASQKEAVWDFLSLAEDYLKDRQKRSLPTPSFDDAPLRFVDAQPASAPVAETQTASDTGASLSARAGAIFQRKDQASSRSAQVRPDASGRSSNSPARPSSPSSGGLTSGGQSAPPAALVIEPAPIAQLPNGVGIDPSLTLETLAGDSLEKIGAEASACRRCHLCDSRAHVCVGVGVSTPQVLVIGEGPNAEEDEASMPFVGESGALLDKMLSAIGLSRDKNVYLTNVVKCRPPLNREPAPEEQAACSAYLLRQVAVTRPRAILCVGRIPSQALLGTREPITRLRGRAFSFRGIPLFPAYHPNALLRDESLKRPAWEDLKRVRDYLNQNA
jgi:uracil-DNA glycosylase